MMNDIVMTLLVNAAVFSLLAGVILLVRKLLAKKISAVLQYALWAVVVVKLIIPFGFESAISPLNWWASVPSIINPSDIQTDPMTPDITYDIQTNISTQTEAIQPVQKNTTQPAGYVNPVQPAAQKPLSWEAWALIIWGAGAAATGGWLLLCRRHLRRRMNHGRVEAPEHFALAFSACKIRLGIKRAIGLCIQPAVQVPAITGLFKPVLILPESLMYQDENELAHIFLHELTHYKKGDLAMITLLNVLNVIYWFNPVAWICFKLMRKDMETICDQKVLGLLAREKQNGYVQTVLKYAGTAGSENRLQAAMSLNDGRIRMERRIREMFRKRKTGKGTRVVIALVAIMMLGGCVLTACQPTPEKPVVAGKNDGQLEQKIGQPAAPEKKYDAPATWQANFSKNKAAVTVDAKVEVPGVSKYPVLNVKDAGFTQEQVNKLEKVLLQGKPMFKMGGRSTKAELTERLINMKAALEKKKKDTKSSDNSIEDFQTIIKSLEEQIPSAPEKAEIKSSDGKLQSQGGLSQIQVNADLGKKEPASLWVIANTRQTMVQYLNGIRYYDYAPVDKHGTAKIKTTKDGAIAKARKLLNDIGVDYMDVANVYVGVSFEGEAVQKTNIQGYIIDFTRTVEGIPTTFEQAVQAGGLKDKDTQDYITPWFYEKITVCIDDTGITAFEWRGNIEIKDKASENVALMPFEQIMERFSQQMLAKYAPGKEDISSEGADTYACLIKHRYKIDRIVLGMQQVSMKDKPGEYMLLPVWKFYGEQGSEMDIDAYMETVKKKGIPDKDAAEIRKSMEQNDGVLMQNDNAFVILNAIDGSEVDTYSGY